MAGVTNARAADSGTVQVYMKCMLISIKFRYLLADNGCHADFDMANAPLRDTDCSAASL